MKNLQDILKVLKTAPRQGTEKDEPEGKRFIQISDTLAKEMIECLENIIINLKEEPHEKE